MNIYMTIIGGTIIGIGYAFFTFLLEDNNRFNFDIKWVYFSIIISIYTITYNLIINVTDDAIYRVISIIIVLIILNKYLLKKKWIKSIFDTIIMFISSLIGELILLSYMIGILKIELTAIYSSFILDIIVSTFTFVFGVIILILIKKFILRHNDIISSNIFILNLLTVTIVTLLSGSILQKNMYNGYDSSKIFETGIVVVLITIAFFSMFLTILYLINKESLNKLKLKKIEKTYEYDSLTGCLIRGFGVKKIELLLRKSKKNSVVLTICYIDVNNLKRVNDTFGHYKGDEMLNIICDVIKKKLRKDDYIIRFGGDEFVLLFYGIDEIASLEILERVNNELELIEFVMPISFAVGIKSFLSDDNICLDNIINEIDQKMYENKKLMKSVLKGECPKSLPLESELVYQ